VQAREHLGLALTIYKEIHAAQGTAQVLFWTGMLALRTRQPEDARDGFQEALGLVRQINDRAGEVQCLRGLGLADRALGDVEGAKAKLNEALQLARQPGPTQLESLILENLNDLD
jgi:tetratricopeptide (TPR) repeat protein